MNYYSNWGKQKEDSWDDDTFDKEKEGYLPNEDERGDNDYYGDDYGSGYYFDPHYFRQNDYYSYEKQSGTEKDKIQKGDSETHASAKPGKLVEKNKNQQTKSTAKEEEPKGKSAKI